MISSLSNVSIEEIYRSFIDAFKDYEVKIDMSIDKFNEMLITRSYNKEFSVGFYEKSVLVGFLLVGYRKIGNKKVLYDTGTGVIEEYRRKGIGNRLLNETKKIMKENDINTFLLEVLENNLSAIELYKNSGFFIKRKFNCFEITEVTDHDGCIIEKEVKEIDIKARFEEYCSFEPSWQNSFDSYLNVRDNYSLLTWENEKTIIGYGIIHKYNGNVMQIGLKPDYRSIQYLSKIINGLIKRTSSSRVKYLNVEDRSEIDRLLKKLNQIKIAGQYEMIYERK